MKHSSYPTPSSRSYVSQLTIAFFNPVLTVLIAALSLNDTVSAHGSLHDVIERRTEAIAEQPDNALLFFERGMLYQKHGDLDLALADFQQALQLEPAYYICHLPLSELYLEKKQVAIAFHHINFLLEREPDNPFAYGVRATIYEAQNQHSRVVSDLRRMLELKNDEAVRPEDFLRLSNALLTSSTERFEEAIAALEEGLSRLGNIITLREAIIELEVKNHRCEAALKRIEQVLATLPRREKWLLRKAEILELNGQPGAAYRVYRQAREEAGSAYRYSPAVSGVETGGNSVRGDEPPVRSAGLMTTVTRGPYLQMGTPQSMTVRWRTDQATDSKIWYGSSPSNLDNSISAAGSLIDHELTVSGLIPNTRYYYAVGHSGGILAGGTAEHFFETSPPPGSTQTVRAWVLGDCGTADEKARSVRDGYYNYIGNNHTDLILLLGDNAYDSGTDAEYQVALFQDMYEDRLIQSVLWPSIGNHDIKVGNSVNQLDPYFDIFTLPRNGEAGGLGSGTEAYYSFDYANIHFVVLDSEYDPGRVPGSPMLVWLENDLAATTQEWTIVYWHHPPYSKGTRDSDSESQQIEMRENVVPILETYGVDLVMGGHSHNYERSFLLHGHHGYSNTLIPSMILDNGDGRLNGDGAYEKINSGGSDPDGAVYVVAGSAGKSFDASLDHPVMYYSAKVIGSVSLEITGSRLDFKFIDIGGNVLDYFTLQKSEPVGNPPSAAITAPADGAYYASTQTITLQADASDSDGTISEVTFVVDGNEVGTDNTAPYSVDWTIPYEGSFSIQARAKDNDDNLTTSASVNITVGSIQVCSRVVSGNDDAEENGGSVNLSSSDLELNDDNQIIGMRFTDIDIPQGATISSAYLQFTVDETRNVNPCNLTIYGQDSDDAASFTGSSNNVSGRPPTGASVAWAPPDWTSAGAAGPDQRTPDISPVIQEIVNRPGFTAGNSIVLIIDGEGSRTAASYNGSATQAPELCIEYTTETPDCPAASANIGDPCTDNDPCTTGDVYGADCICAGTFQDSDGDNVCDANDACPGGDDALDDDSDGIPDDCDICAGGDDTVDTDSDGIPDDCDICADGDDTVDTDSDGIPDDCDICADGDDTVDTDSDGIPDDCDICADGDDTVDTDSDGIPDDCDICADGDDTVDTDSDGIPDDCDICPDGDNTVDGDGDGIPDNCDTCPGSDDALDADGDGVPDDCDACPGGDDALDADGDGVPDDCDACPGGDDALDDDSDGVPDDCDACPGGPEPGAACNDDNPNTTGETIQEDCSCGGGTDVNCDYPQSMEIDNIPIDPGLHRALETITSQGRVDEDTDVTFMAGGTITLGPGFHAMARSSFHAMIEPCVPMAQNLLVAPRPSSENFSRLSGKQPFMAAYPNPFRDEAVIEYRIHESAPVILELFSVAGVRLKLLQETSLVTAGVYRLRLSSAELEPGMLLLRLESGEDSIIRKLLLMR